LSLVPGPEFWPNAPASAHWRRSAPRFRRSCRGACTSRDGIQGGDRRGVPEVRGVQVKHHAFRIQRVLEPGVQTVGGGDKQLAAWLLRLAPYFDRAPSGASKIPFAPGVPLPWPIPADYPPGDLGAFAVRRGLPAAVRVRPRNSTTEPSRCASTERDAWPRTMPFRRRWEGRSRIPGVNLPGRRGLGQPSEFRDQRLR
jgi:hypothetical protein